MRMIDPETHPVTSRIERRAIEAQAVAPIIRVLEKRIGRDDAIALLTEINQQEAFSRGSAVADETAQDSAGMFQNTSRAVGCPQSGYGPRVLALRFGAA